MGDTGTGDRVGAGVSGGSVATRTFGPGLLSELRWSQVGQRWVKIRRRYFPLDNGLLHFAVKVAMFCVSSCRDSES